MIELTIDGKVCKAEKGQTILQVAMANGIYIPHLCWDRRLKPFGGCRVCLVEVEGQRKLMASCSTPAEDGMVVHTNTPTLQKARRTVLELLLVHHPLDCPICDKAGECSLQDMAYRYGPSQERFKAEKKHEPEATSPLIERNPNRCILCGRCVRVCWEHQGVGAINFIGRGFNTKISPAFEETLDCEFCGQCIDACPVGALGAKPYKYRARAWFLESHDSICPYCSVGCTLTLDLREERILRVRGIDGKGLNKGDLCGKGRFGFDFIYSEKRLSRPLKRIDGELKEVSWEEAIYFVAERLRDIKELYGSESIGAIGSTRATLEDNYMFQRFFREVIGTDNIDTSARLGYAWVLKAMKNTYGIDTYTARLDAPLGKDVVLVLESDITSTQPIFGLKFLEAKAEGTNLIVADPRQTKLARRSTHWLRIRPSTSTALILGMINYIFREGLHLKEPLRAEGIDQLMASTKGYTIERVSEITGLAEEDILYLYTTFTQAENPLIAITIGAAENHKGIETLTATCNLMMLLGKGPEFIQSPPDYSNTLGAWIVGVRPLKDGKNLYEMLYQEGLKALYIMGEDPLVTMPGGGRIEEVLKELELLVVQDIRMSETAKHAHLVLPASAWAEKDGTFVNLQGIAQSFKKVIPAAGDSIPDWQILRNIARVIGSDLGFIELSQIRKEICEITTEETAQHWRFSSIDWKAPEITEEYPLLLITGNIMQHSGALSVMSKSLSHVLSDAFVQISPEDAARFSIKDETFIKITSELGSVLIKARVSDEVPEGMVFVPVHFAHARVNSLVKPNPDGRAHPEPVRIEQAE